MIYRQPGWRFCFKCQGYFFGPGAGGVCAAGGLHDPSGSGAYVTENATMSVVPAGQAIAETVGRQGGWAYCRKCSSLFLTTASARFCAAGGLHDPSGSGTYFTYYRSPSLDVLAAGYQLGWRRCTSCASMFFIGNRSQGVCSGTKAGHVADGTTDYAMLGGGPLDVPGDATLLVVAPPPLVPSIQPLVDHRNAAGVPTRLVSFDPALLGRIPGRDDAARLKWAITYAVEYLRTRYVFLVGDPSVIPVRHRYIYWDDVDWRTGTYAPTDLYYANLYGGHAQQAGGATTNTGPSGWDANGNGKYNELIGSSTSANPDMVDAYVDVAIGRLPTRSAGEVSTYVRKVIAFENGSLRHWTKSFSLIADGLYDDIPSCWQTLSAVGGLGGGNWPTIDEVGINYEATHAPPSGIRRAGPTDTLAQILGRSAWVGYIGHGASDAWHFIAEASSIAALPSATNVPVVAAIGCSTAQLCPFAADGSLALTNPNNTYVDVHGTPHNYAVQGGQIVDSGSSPPRQWPLSSPITPEEPSVYQPQCPTVARQWLCSSASAGAVAYFGEQTVTMDIMGAELIGHLLSHASRPYAAGQVLGDLWVAACRDYWRGHARDTNWSTASRVYLSIMTMYGDPALRL